MPSIGKFTFIAAMSVCVAATLTSCSPSANKPVPEKLICKITQSYADATFWYPNWKPKETHFAGFGGYVCDQNVLLTVKELQTGSNTLTAKAFYVSTKGTENLVGLVNSEKDIKKLGLELMPLGTSGFTLKAGEKFQVIAELEGNSDVLQHKGLQKKSILMDLNSRVGGGLTTITAYSNIGTK
jgi:hypothetical protein